MVSAIVNLLASIEATPRSKVGLKTKYKFVFGSRFNTDHISEKKIWMNNRNGIDFVT